MSHMTPSEIVSELDKHIVGQDAAKRAVAIALRNRWRRQQVPEPLRHEITPKNILMIGPTGVGKTEIARRLARLAEAPFIKVEATKFTEVGYVGRDVDTIIRDLVEAALKQTREAETRKVRDRAADAAEERLLDVLLPPAREVSLHDMQPTDSTTRQKFRKMLREGKLDDKEVEVEVSLLVPSDGDHGAARHGGSHEPAAGNVPAAGRRAAEAQEDDGRRSAEGADGRGGREAHQRRRDEGARADRGRAERHRVPGRDRQDREPPGDARRRRLAPGRAARPPAAGRGHDGLDQARHGAHRPHPVHRLGCLPFLEAVRPDPRAAGPLSDPGRALLALGQRLRADPDSHRRLPRAPVPGAARDRERAPRLQARRDQAARGDRVRRQRAAGEHRRTAPAYGDGAAARRALVPGDPPHRRDVHDRRRLRRCEALGHRRRRKPRPLHSSS